MKNYYWGLLAEYIAVFWYSCRFYNIIARRMRNHAGEIDIICARGKLLVFVEVKARMKELAGDVFCHPKQQERITRAARLFVQKNQQYIDYDMRFDVIVIRAYKLPILIENAWLIDEK